MEGNKQKRIARRSLLAAPTFGYAQVEAALAKVYDAEDVQRTAFRGRLKHFRKLGIPQQQPGKGSRIRYTGSDIFQLMVACEFAEFGIDPHLITNIIRQHWRLKLGLFQAIDLTQRFPQMIFSSLWNLALCLGSGIGKKPNIRIAKYLRAWWATRFSSTALRPAKAKFGSTNCKKLASAFSYLICPRAFAMSRKR